MEKKINGLTIHNGQIVWAISNLTPSEWQKCRVHCGNYLTQSGSYFYLQPINNPHAGASIAFGNIAKISSTEPPTHV